MERLEAIGGGSVEERDREEMEGYNE